jgi:hypothetical protein
MVLAIDLCSASKRCRHILRWINVALMRQCKVHELFPDQCPWGIALKSVAFLFVIAPAEDARHGVTVMKRLSMSAVAMAAAMLPAAADDTVPYAWL